jgi:DNA repair exonuclease SbcCD ATPase subunit
MYCTKKKKSGGNRRTPKARMILEQLTLRNFCLFAWEQAFDLRPGGAKSGICLSCYSGASTGGGKTTLLDAIQLALYGVRARCSKRRKVSDCGRQGVVDARKCH